MTRGDYVLICDIDRYQAWPETKMVGSGVILEDYDIPDTFGRRMYVILVGGQQKTYDDGFYSFKVLSKTKRSKIK